MKYLARSSIPCDVPFIYNNILSYWRLPTSLYNINKPNNKKDVFKALNKKYLNPTAKDFSELLSLVI